MEKRQFPRLKVSIEAVINIGEGEGYTCRIEDFSQDGMFLTVDERFIRSEIRAKIESMEAIASVTFKATKKYVSIDSVIVHQHGDGMGVKFLRRDPKYLSALNEAAEREAAHQANPKANISGAGNLAAAKKSNLAKQINSRIKHFFEDRFPEYFVSLEKHFIAEAERQSSDAAQHQFFDALSGYKKHAKNIVENVISEVCSDSSDIANGRFKEDSKRSFKDNSDQSLSLIEKDDFEDWLIVKVATSRAELQFREELIELQLRLDAAFGDGSKKRLYNPYAPAAICQAYYASVRHLKLTQKVERLVFKLFQEEVLASLGGLYKVINKLFVDADVLPDIDVARYLASQAKDKAKSGPTAAPEALAESADNTGNGEPEENAGVAGQANDFAQNTSAPIQPTLSQQAGLSGQPAASSSEELLSQAGGVSPLETPFQQVQEGLARARNAYSTASKLWQVHSHVEASDGQNVRQPMHAELPLDVVREIGQAIHQVKQQLLRGHVNLDTPGSLKHYLAQASGPDSNINEGHYESADMIESLFNNIIENERIEQSLRSDLRKLEIPLLEVLLTDPTLFTAEFHPVRQAVNYLALLADKGSIHINSNSDVLRECIDLIVQSDPKDQSGVNQALDKLDGLIQKEKKYIERNLNRVTEACEGQQKVKDANGVVEKELQRRFEDKDVPKFILDLVEFGWRELMRLCYFREGIDSRAWEMTLIVLDQLMLRLMPGEYDESKVLFRAEELHKLIEKGLSKVPNASSSRTKVVQDLGRSLIKGDAGDLEFQPYSSPENVSETELDKLKRLGLEDDDKAIQRWMKRARSLKEGQWLEFEANTERSQLNQLAWVSDQCDRFVFVNHHGMKVLDTPLEELAVQLRDGDAIVLSDSSLPAVEKGLDALVQKIYDQLAFESAHDQLTGLKTRKEFERCLAQSVARAKKSDKSYVLIFIDILQFKVINNTCGYEAGDGFLRDIANRIKSVVFDDAEIGRIGGNEFGVLQEVESEQKGYLIASEIKSAIEEKRFTSADRNFVISTVVSMVAFDSSNNQVMELLRSVESAADIGKKSGQKEIQVVHPGDERMEERDEVMSWVARINRALDEENLKVRCQMIAPIIDNDTLLPHFEVLLTVVDENGEHLPPTDFIKAAEEYSRMGSVDRWVIDNVLRWVVENPALMNQIGGFSINLSGHSLNDETFLDFLFESLVRHQVPREKLIFEITETTAVANLEDAADFINEMRGIGCRFSLDDFGAGQSSYAYLKRLPVDFIKIDGAFVRNITDDDVDYALVKSITEMGHFLNKKIVAEFVSSEEILEVVRDIGVDYVQGYYLGKPVMIEDLHNSLEPEHKVA